jgi:hypothetical protein
MSAESAWQKVSDNVRRLAKDLEITLGGGGPATAEPAMQFRWRDRSQAAGGARIDEGAAGAVADIEQQTPTSMSTSLDFPELGAGLELEIEQELPEMSVTINVRPIYPEVEVEQEGEFRVIYRRDDEDRMACWIGRGDEITIPNVEEGQFVLVVVGRDVPCIYEIPLHLHM